MIYTMDNNDILVNKLSPDLQMIYKIVKMLQTLGGTGSIEIHFLRGRIKDTNGIYMKPGFDREVLDRVTTLLQE